MDPIHEEDESDSGDEEDSDEDLLKESMFNISKRVDSEEEPVCDSSSDEMPKPKNFPPLGSRGTILEDPDEHNDDSFEIIRKEKKNKKKFMEFEKKIDQIKYKVEKQATTTKEKLAQTISSLKQI